VRQLRRAPWFLISALVHLCALVVLTTSVARQPGAEGFAGALQVGIYSAEPKPAEQPPEEEDPPPKPETPELPKVEPVVPPPAPPQTRPISEENPAASKASPVFELPGGANPSRGPFASRGPVARREALRRWGGSPGSEEAVDAGLDWLYRHQEPESGRWTDGDPQWKLAPSLTGLAVLAFLGKGHTHTAPGPYRHTVARGIAHLRRIQTPDGRFGQPYLLHGERDNRYLMYHQAIATLALAEAYGMTRDPQLRDPIRRAVAYIERAQQYRGGWDYGPNRTGRNDTSVTGWQLMALKSAHTAGLEVRWQTLFGVMRHLSIHTDSLGQVIYADRPPPRTYGRRGPGMVAVGMLCYQMLGWPHDSKLLVRQADHLLRDLPDWKRMQQNDPKDVRTYLHTMYYWYYGSLAMFSMGGRWWRRWNERLRDLLIAHQGRAGERRGSWDPPEAGFDALAGRVYTTALNVLNLEIYYRYLPFYRGGSFDAIDVLERAAKVRGRDGTRQRALRLLAAFPTERAQAILASALDDPDGASRIVAQRALAEQRSELVVPSLLADLSAESSFARSHAIATLAQFGQKRFVPHFIKALCDPEKVVRLKGALALRKVAGENLGFRADAEPKEREQAIAQWERWWRGESTEPPPGGIRGTVLVVDAEAPDAVVLDVGRDDAVRRGLRFEVVRADQTIAILEADRVEPTLTVARVVERRGDAVQEGDAVRSLPQPKAPRREDE